MGLRQLSSLSDKLLRANNHVVDILKRMHILIVNAPYYGRSQPIAAVGIHCDILLNTRLVVADESECRSANSSGHTIDIRFVCDIPYLCVGIGIA